MSTLLVGIHCFVAGLGIGAVIALWCALDDGEGHGDE